LIGSETRDALVSGFDFRWRFSASWLVTSATTRSAPHQELGVPFKKIRMVSGCLPCDRNNFNRTGATVATFQNRVEDQRRSVAAKREHTRAHLVKHASVIWMPRSSTVSICRGILLARFVAGKCMSREFSCVNEVSSGRSVGDNSLRARGIRKPLKLSAFHSG
jgi:hypothetical protein